MIISSFLQGVPYISMLTKLYGVFETCWNCNKIPCSTLVSIRRDIFHRLHRKSSQLVTLWVSWNFITVITFYFQQKYSVFFNRSAGWIVKSFISVGARVIHINGPLPKRFHRLSEISRRIGLDPHRFCKDKISSQK